MSLNHFTDQELRNQLQPYLASPNIVVNSKINVVGTVPTAVPNSINIASVVRNGAGVFNVTYKKDITNDASLQVTAFDRFSLITASSSTGCTIEFFLYGGITLSDPLSFSLLCIK